jgi:hypothetical protein
VRRSARGPKKRNNKKKRKSRERRREGEKERYVGSGLQSRQCGARAVGRAPSPSARFLCPLAPSHAPVLSSELQPTGPGTAAAGGRRALKLGLCMNYLLFRGWRSLWSNYTERRLRRFRDLAPLPGRRVHLSWPATVYY